ncbi:MAG TPA: flagellar biosynthetic protein FliR [Candidatus Obscuribacterales bacterium]
MEWLLQFSNQLPALGLVVLRSSGLFFSAPLFGQSRIPMIVRAMFALAIGVLVFPFLKLAPGQVPNNVINWMIAAGLEVTVGVIYGWGATLVFEGMVLAGQLIGLQMGFGQANVLNPESQTQRPLLSEIYFILALMVFFSFNGHHFFILAFEKSFDAVPLAQFAFSARTLEQLMTLFSQVFLIALVIAAPMCGVLTFIDIVLGLIARTAPQMNVLIISFSIKIYIGLLTLLISLSFTLQFLRDTLPALLEQLLRLF